MKKLINSLKKKLKKWLRYEEKVTQSIPIGPILKDIGRAKYGDAYSVIAHGGGGTQYGATGAHLYTNSIASIMDSIEDGKKLIEIDLAVTSDNKIVGVHNWAELKSLMGYKGIHRQVLHDSSPLSYEEVRAFEFEPGVSPVDIDELNAIFSQHEDLILVVDKIDNLESLLASFAYPKRLIVEVFDVKSFDKAARLGIENVVFNINIKKKRIVDWVIDNRITAVTFSAHALKYQQRAYENALKLREAGVVSLVYSSNEDSFIKQNVGITVSAVYTDYWSLNKQSSVVLGANVTY